MKWIAKYWPVITGVVLAAVFVGQSLWTMGAMRAELVHSVDDATDDRTRLHQEDVKIHKRVDEVEDKVTPLKETMIKIETQQTAIQNGVNKLDKKMNRMLQRKDR
jgi:predicted  nucleic acid-binding Zn-ribbon protein